MVKKTKEKLNKVKKIRESGLIKTIIIFLFIIYLCVLPLRSALYVWRIYKEFTQPVEPYLPNVDPCDPDYYPNTSYEAQLYNYMKFDKICEN